MYHRYQSDYPNQVHQLLVTVSKHFHIGAKGQFRYQSKQMEVSLERLDKANREHVIHYILRDHFSGVYYAEMASGKNPIPICDFLLRAWLLKPGFAFCGVPDALMVTKIADRFFPEIIGLLEELRVEKINPPSGFASGMRDVIEWEKQVRFYTITYPVMESFKMWTPRASEIACANNDLEKVQIWLRGEARLPDKDYISYLKEKFGSHNFKTISEYPTLEEAQQLTGL